MNFSPRVLLPVFSTLALSASLMTGCGNQEEDLNLESLPVVTSEDEKSDNPISPSFYWIRPSRGTIACVRPPCPIAEGRRVNSWERQLIYKFDLRGLKLSSNAQQAFDTQRGSLLLYGKYTTATAYGEKVTVLQVTRATGPVSQSSSDNLDSDSYYSIKERTSPSCTGDNCPAFEISMLGGGVVGPIQIAGVNLTRLELNEAQKTSLMSELKAGTAYLSITGVKNLIANVSQAFRPLSAPPLTQ